MRKVADQDGPVLCRVRVVANLLRDHLAQPRVLCKPSARDASHGMPADLYRPRPLLELGLRQRDGIWLLPEADGMLEGQLAFVDVFGPVELAGSASGSDGHVQEVAKLVALPLPFDVLFGSGHCDVDEGVLIRVSCAKLTSGLQPYVRAASATNRDAYLHMCWGSRTSHISTCTVDDAKLVSSYLFDLLLSHYAESPLCYAA